MREIKFKAWDKELKRMTISFDFDSFLDARDSEYGTGAIPDLSGCELMQFTGLTDKNGKEIYEGDIVKFNKQGKEVIAAVEYHEKAASFTPYARAKKRGSYREFEIIGNIYENEGLLK